MFSFSDLLLCLLVPEVVVDAVAGDAVDAVADAVVGDAVDRGGASGFSKMLPNARLMFSWYLS